MCGGPKKLDILSMDVITMDLTIVHRAPDFRVATVLTTPHPLSTTVGEGINPCNS